MSEFPDTFLHGSMRAFEPGFTLVPRGEAYAADWEGTGFHGPIERGRPEGFRPQADSVFLSASTEDVELSGGGTEWCLEVVPTGPVTRHDVNWANEVSSLVDAGHGPDSVAIRRAVAAYWSGTPHPNESVWEFLAPAARVTRCVPFDEYAPEGAPNPRGV